MTFFYIFFLSYFFIRLFQADIKKFYFLSPFLLVNLIIIFLYLLVDEITGSGFTRSFWYHLNFDLESGTYKPYLLSFIIKISVFLFAILLLLILSLKIFSLKKKFLLRCSIIILIINPSSYSLISSYFDWKNSYSDNGVNLQVSDYFFEGVNLDDNFEKRDLIFISAESFERTFYKKKLLNQLNLQLINRKDIIDFKNIKEIENYTDWTIAGLVASNCGKPIIYLNNSKTLDYINSFSPDSVCLSDLLDQLKYDQYLIQGSSLKFGGNGDFYKIHKVRQQYGKQEIQKENIRENLELSHWGIHDNHVLNFAKKKIIQLEKKGNPFAVWINTLDNHAPSGLLSNYCKEITPSIPNQMLRITKCTDIFLNDFIEKVFAVDKNRNNLIVIHSDHLLMNSHFQKKYFKNKKKRRNLFIIVDPYKIKNKKEYFSSGNHFDIPATVLNYLSLNDKIGFGKSLFDEKFSSFDLDYSISNDFNDFQIIKSYEKEVLKKNKDLFLIGFKFDMSSGQLVFKNDIKISTPAVITEKNIYLPSQDVDGNLKENLIEILYLNKKKILSEKEFRIIANCNQLNSFFDLNEKCKFGKLKITKKKEKYLLDFKKIDNKGEYFLKNDQKFEKVFYKENNFLKKKFDIYYNQKPNESLQLLSAKVKYLLINISPKLFSFARELYRETKYFILKVKINGIKNIFFPEKTLISNKNFIGHAGGSIDGKIYTNSLEALNLNYEKGIRIFELDLRLTSDNKLVAVHDWKNWRKNTGYEKKIPPNKDDFLSYDIFGSYSPLDLDSIKNWKKIHQDTIIITDKFDDLETLSKIFKRDQNFIHEIYSDNELLFAFDNNISNILVSEKILRNNNFSEKFLQKLIEKNVYGLSVSRHSLYKFAKFYKKAKDNGLKIFVYRLNDGLPGGTEKEVLCNFSDYLNAVYADKLTNFDLESSKLFCD